MVESYLFPGGHVNGESAGSSEPAGRGSPTAPRPSSSTITETSQPVLDVLSTLTQEIHRLGSAITSIAPATGVPNDPRQVNGGSNLSADDRGDDGRTSKRRRTDDGPYTAHQRTPNSEHEDQQDEVLSDSFYGHRLTALLREFFNRVQPWLPILHLTRFAERAADGHQKPKILIILHAINFVALRFVVDEDGTPLPPEYVARQVKISRDHVLLTAMSSLSIENLQALTIVAFSDVRVQLSWDLTGSS